MITLHALRYRQWFGLRRWESKEREQIAYCLSLSNSALNLLISRRGRRHSTQTSSLANKLLPPAPRSELNSSSAPLSASPRLASAASVPRSLPLLRLRLKQQRRSGLRALLSTTYVCLPGPARPLPTPALPCLASPPPPLPLPRRPSPLRLRTKSDKGNEVQGALTSSRMRQGPPIRPFFHVPSRQLLQSVLSRTRPACGTDFSRAPTLSDSNPQRQRLSIIIYCSARFISRFTLGGLTGIQHSPGLCLSPTFGISP